MRDMNGGYSKVAILVLVDNPFGEGDLSCQHIEKFFVAILVLVDNPFGETQGGAQPCHL
mgnify:CR=1 FL=1